MAAYSPYFYGGATQPNQASGGWTNPYQNPYSQKVTLYDGTQVNVAPTMGALGAAGAWQDQQSARTNNPTLATSANTSSGGTSGPFSTLRNPKNSGVDNAVSGILDQVKGLTNNPATNTNVVKATVKNPAMAARTTTAAKQYDADVNNVNQTLKDFVTNWLAGQSGSEANAAQESAAIGRVYDEGDGGLAAQLAQIARQRNIGINQAATRAMQGAQAQSNAARLTQPGSSYLSAMLNNQLGGIATQTAIDKAEQDRANALTMLEAQTNLAGRRNALSDAALQRYLMPIQATQQTMSGNLSNLGTLLNLDAANTNYQIDNPESLLARKLALLGDTSRLDLANTFYGLQKPYESDNSGLFAPRYSVGAFGGGGDFNLSDFFPDSVTGGGGGNPGTGGTRASAPSVMSNYMNSGYWIPGGTDMSRADQATLDYLAATGFLPNDDPASNLNSSFWPTAARVKTAPYIPTDIFNTTPSNNPWADSAYWGPTA